MAHSEGPQQHAAAPQGKSKKRFPSIRSSQASLAVLPPGVRPAAHWPACHAPAAWRRCCQSPAPPCAFQGCKCTTAPPAAHRRGGEPGSRRGAEGKGRQLCLGAVAAGVAREQDDSQHMWHVARRCCLQHNPGRAPAALPALWRPRLPAWAVMTRGAGPAGRAARCAPPGPLQLPSQSGRPSRRSPAAGAHRRGACGPRAGSGRLDTGGGVKDGTRQRPNSRLQQCAQVLGSPGHASRRHLSLLLGPGQQDM